MALPMTFKLRSYQKECIDTVCSGFDEGLSAQLVQLPTGSGKTVIFWHIIKQRGDRALIVAPTRELTEQVEQTGQVVCSEQTTWRKHSSYWQQDFHHCVMTTQSATFALRKGKLAGFRPSILIVDEAHRSRSEGLQELIEHYKAKDVPVLGLTATPERLDGKSLLEVYDTLSYEKTLIELMRAGHLVDLKCYRVRTGCRLTNVKINMGDIAPVSLKQLETDERDKIIGRTCTQQLKGKKTIVFCLSVRHAQSIAERLRADGEKAQAIYGDMSKRERERILRDFASGEIRILCNCQLLTEGFDEPSIEAVVLARPTKSKALYCQMVGRGVRPYSGKKHCLVYDMTDEVHNICSFNVLGGLALNDTRELIRTNGQSLLDAAVKLVEQKANVTDVEYELFRPYIALDDIAATPSQVKRLQEANIPHLEDITMPQAGYLLLKDRIMGQYGYDRRAHWKKWRNEIQGFDTSQRFAKGCNV